MRPPTLVLLLVAGCGGGDRYANGKFDTTAPSSGFPTSSTTTPFTPEPQEAPGDTGGRGDCSTLRELFLSPDDSNSMSSPVLARQAAALGRGLPSVRPYEFMNYYDFPYPRAEPGWLTLSAALEQSTDDPGEFTLQIGLGSEAMDRADRPPVNLTLVLDTSCTITATWRDPRTLAPRTIRETFTFDELLDGDPSLLLKGRAVYQTAEVLRGWQLTGETGATPGRDAAVDSVAAARELMPGDPDLDELDAMLHGLR